MHLSCALAIGIIRMAFMGIPPLALTGAIFGAFFQVCFTVFQRVNLYVHFREVIGTGIIRCNSFLSCNDIILGKNRSYMVFYVPSFIAGTLIGGSIAFIFLKQLQKAKLYQNSRQHLVQMYMKVQMLSQMMQFGIACLGFIGYLVTVVIVNNFVANPTGFVSIIKYIVFAVFIIAAVVILVREETKEGIKRILCIINGMM